MRFGTNWRRERRSITSPFLTNFSIALCCVLVLSTWQAGFLYAQTYPSQSVTVGYRDYNYGNTVYPMPTSEKPENKLWWNDGFWWGSLWDPNANSYRIHRFSVANQSWTSVGPNIDNRPQSLADVLWDGQKLYISSHISELTSATGPGRLYRYSYNASTQSYSLDSGFPVDISSKQSETLTLTKDSSGQLWASWVEGSKVMVNCSQSSDQSWGTPFQLPVQNSTVGSDDISVIVAFGGHRVGILWSNQNDKKMYFAVHRDADGDNAWQLRETALSDGTKPVADDHMNVKIMTDGSGDIYAVTKSSTSTSSDPLIYLLKRASGGGWASYVVATKSENHTRAIMALDEENRRIYIFMARLSGSPRCIYVKSSDLDNIHFVPGVGDEFIRSESDAFVNDPTSTRQNVNSQTGILILASDETTHNYLHNYLSLGGGNPPPPNQPPVAMASASPTIGVSPLTVNFSSAGSNDPDGTISSYAWDFRDGSSSTQANPSHTYNSAGDYSAILTVTDNKSASNNATVLISVSPAVVGAVPSITSFSPTSGPVGTQVTIVGNNFSGSTQVVFNSTAAASFSIDSDMQMRTTVPAGASTGKISITNNSGIGTSTNNFSVTTSSGGSTITFTPTADTHVNSSSPTRNYGAESSFRIRSGSPAFSAYLKFNVTGLSGAVTRATLRMYVIDDGPYGGAVYSVSNNYKGTSTPWLEEGLNWNNAPALSGTPVAVAGAAKLNAWLEWDVTAALSGDGVFSFGLNSTSTNSVYFSSKEGASAPQLIIETGSGMAVQAPVAQASATPESGVTPLSVNFSSAGSYDPDGSINSYSWNFGDGSSSTQANPAHTYNNAGNYAAVLTVHDNQGAMRTSTVNIAVAAAPSALPTAPSNLVATTAGTNAINLSWNDNTSDEDGYHIERKTGASGTYSEIATVDANVTTYGNSGLAQNTAYYYRVRAHNGSGNSAFSNESNATTQSSGGVSANLALNRPAAASGYYDSAHAPEKAVDGRLDKYWRSQTVSSSSPLAWLQIDLQSAQLVGRAVVSWKDGYFAKSYQVQVSNDASSWTTVYTNSSGAAGAQDFIFPAVTVRYVRLYCTVQNMSSYRVLELELYSGGMAKSGTQEDDQSERMPHTIALQQNYPNPFNPSTKISYSVPEGMHVTLKVYDIIGNAVAILVNGYRAPGVYTVNFNGAHLSAGTYYYVLQAGGTRIVRRLSLVK